jgi:UDP-2,3-diacylglucosamine pyrophosphatase LpxH
VRTLVISDLHIGQPGGTAVLERPKPLQILTETLAGFDRLVLLGDTIEMTEGSWSHSALTAAPILRRLGQSIGKIVFLPGNHDHRLIQSWVQSQGRNLDREAIVPHDASPELAELIGWLQSGGAEVEVRYPGVWLSEKIWATHGHYLNHYLRPTASVGLFTKEQRSRPPASARPDQFEHIVYDEQKPELAEGQPPRRWHDKLIPKRIAPVLSWALDLQVRRHALPAFGQVAAALDVAGRTGDRRGLAATRAEHAIFGHIHRFGPLPLDNPREWRTTPNSGIDLQLLNTGSWRYEPVLVSGSDQQHPYWPGGSIQIGEDGVPHPVNLLAGLPADDLR